MKAYLTATDALIDHLRFLQENGKFNSAELSHQMRDAKVLPGEMLSESMFRQLRNGRMTRMVEHRAVAACRIFGIQVSVVNPNIPSGWKAKKV